MVVLVPVPVVVPPGVLVRVHVPDAGKSLRTTLPVGTIQVGWVIVPTVGASMWVTVIVKGVAELAGHPDVPVTCKLPEAADAGKLTVMLFVVPPPV